MLALTKNDAMPRLLPYCFLNASLRRSRSAMTAVMSISLKVVSIAAVRCASTRRRAIVARRLDMRSRRSRRSPVDRRDAGGAPVGATFGCAGAPLDVGAGAERGGAASGRPMAPCTSCFITRPADPEPWT
jgi:hypothetical protein